MKTITKINILIMHTICYFMVIILPYCTVLANNVEENNKIKQQIWVCNNLPMQIEIKDPKTIQQELLEEQHKKEKELLKQKQLEEKQKQEKEQPVYDWKTGYLSATNVNVRQKPNKNAKILKTITFNDEVIYSKIKNNKEWVIVKLKGDKRGYIKKEFISNKEYNERTYDVPTNGFKSYMSYEKITAVSSPQYKLQQTMAYTGDYGIRQVRSRYCVALGSYYATKIGTYFDLILENGTVIQCILGDQKDDGDTDSTNRITCHDGSVTEWITDIDSMQSRVRDVYGDISKACPEFDSPVEKIIVYDYVEEF